MLGMLCISTSRGAKSSIGKRSYPVMHEELLKFLDPFKCAITGKHDGASLLKLGQRMAADPRRGFLKDGLASHDLIVA